jgi:hypothetical protein
VTRDQLIETMARAIDQRAFILPTPVPDGRKMAIRRATAALTAIEAAGMRVVPVEPSQEMQLAGGEAQSRSIGSWGEPALVYRAMLAAAQEDSTSE